MFFVLLKQWIDQISNTQTLKWERQQRNTVRNTKTQTILIRSLPYSLGLRLWSSFQWWPCFIVSLSREITIQGLNVSSPEAGFAWQVGSWIP